MTVPEKQTETAKTTASQKTAKTKAPKTPGRRGGVIFAALLALIAIGGSGYLGYRLELHTLPQIESMLDRLNLLDDGLQTVQESDSQQTDQLDTEIQNLRSQFSAQTAQLTELQTRLDGMNTEFSEKLDAMIESTSSLFQNFDQQPGDWELNDVSLLLLIGAKQLEFTRNPKVVLPIWHSVVEQVERVPDPQLLIVRAQLNREIEMLETAKVADLEEITDRLLNLIESVEALPIRRQVPGLLDDSNAADSEQSVAEDGSGASEMLESVWTDLKSLVKVKKISDAAPLPINPSLKSDLFERIKLSLAAAQIAALQRQAGVYEANLEYVKAVLADQFNVEATSVIDSIAVLDRLLSMAVVAELPDVTGSYDLLQEILDRPSVD